MWATSQDFKTRWRLVLTPGRAQARAMGLELGLRYMEGPAGAVGGVGSSSMKAEYRVVRCRSPRAPEPSLPGGAKSPAPLPVSDKQGSGGKQWGAEGGCGIEDDVGDEVTSTRGSRAKLSSFNCSHKFPSWGGEKRCHREAPEKPLRAPLSKLLMGSREKGDGVRTGTSCVSSGTC